MAHLCHWPGCKTPVPPKMWGCKPHWFSLPKRIRDRIWATYVPGQEVTKTPSPGYLEAARAAQEWALAFERSRKESACARPNVAVGDRGQRYEVRCLDADGKTFTIGWCNDPAGTVFVKMVKAHPSWHDPEVVDRETGEVSKP